MTDFLAKNLAYLLRGDRQAQAAIAEKIGVSQGTISKWSRLHETGSQSEPEFRKMASLARALGVSVDDLAFRDLEADGPSVRASHQPRLDLDRLGTALTAIDKALSDRRIQGKLGTLAEPVKFAYLRAYKIRDLHDQAQRDLFDELVAEKLGSWDGRGDVAEASPGEDSEAPAEAARHRDGAKKRGR